jgi:PAS domain S-box-containing protein
VNIRKASLAAVLRFRDIIPRDDFRKCELLKVHLRVLSMLKRNSYQEQDIHVQEHTWSDAFEHLAVGVAQLTLEGRLLSVNKQMCELIGQPEKELLAKSLNDLFVPQGSWSECRRGLDQLIAGEIPQYSANLSAVRTDEQLVWVEIIFSLVRDHVTNMPRSLTAVAKDVTFLKRAEQELRDAEVMRGDLSRKMMTAQDADRTRIARELHDDIGQSLAVLKIQMLRAGQPVSGNPEMTHASLKDLSGKLEKIINKVASLSHNLHSSELELLGLVAAVKMHCRECSEQLRIPIHCSCDPLQERLDSVIALAFLRVLQEGLHNAMKYSSAKSITVRLTGPDRELTLEISDDGVGFDVEGAKLAAGLGLISMRERIHLIGGEFQIFSTPGQGTRITARAPMINGTR